MNSKSLINLSLVLLVVYSYFEFIMLYSNFFPNSTTTVFTALFFVASVLATLKGKDTIKITKEAIPVLLLFLYFLIHFLISENYGGVLIYLSLVLLVIISLSVPTDDCYPMFLVLGLSLFFSVGVLFHYFFPDIYLKTVIHFFDIRSQKKIIRWMENGWYAGFTHQIGTSATYITYGIFCLVFSKRKKTLLSALLLCGLFFSLFLTGKRMLLFLSGLVPFLSYCFFGKSVNTVLKRLALLFSVLLLCLVLFSSNLEFFANLGGGFKRLADTYSSFVNTGELDEDRMELIRAARDCFFRSPLFGVGWGNYIKISNMGTQAHNVFYQLLAEMGILGVGLFYFAVVYYLFETHRLIRMCATNDFQHQRYLRTSFAFQILFVFHGLTENMLNSMYGYAMYFFFVSVALKCKFELKKDKNEKGGQFAREGTNEKNTTSI